MNALLRRAMGVFVVVGMQACTETSSDTSTSADAARPDDARSVPEDTIDRGPPASGTDGSNDARVAFVDALDAPGADARVVPDAGPPVEPVDPTDPTDAVFDWDHVMTVEVTLPPADWAALRQQGRTDLDTRGADCMDAPFPSPYTWFEGDATLDGRPYARVGVRKKGFFGSLSRSRPSLVLDLDRHVDGQAHETLTRIALNNGKQDPSRLRTCLSYSILADAGVPAPRCHFAHVTVNGEDLGLYAHVESIRKPFLRRHFSDDEGHLYEGALSDFRPGWSGTIEQKTDEDVPHRAPLDAVTAAAAAPDDTLLDALGAVLDLPAFYRFWAAEVMIAHWDGYAGNTNNFWLYEDPAQGGRLVFLPWGPDGALQPPRVFFEGAIAPASVLATGILARRLYLHPEGRRAYLTTLARMVVDHWSTDALLARLDRLAALVGPRMPPQQRADHTRAVAELRTWVAGQRGRLEAELLRGDVPWPYPLRPSLCTVPAGELHGASRTTWASWPTDDAFRSGSGRLEGTYRDVPLAVRAVGGAAGLDENGQAIALVPLSMADGALWFVYLAFDREQITPGELDAAQLPACSLNVFDVETGAATYLADCRDGRLRMTDAALVPGAPFAFEFDVGLWVGLGR
ncbi:CotH kinase family protein [Myxococcota bacterium]|nr:CotH kinase family protein [Myxococcota bacterium]